MTTINGRNYCFGLTHANWPEFLPNVRSSWFSWISFWCTLSSNSSLFTQPFRSSDVGAANWYNKIGHSDHKSSLFKWTLSLIDLIDSIVIDRLSTDVTYSAVDWSSSWMSWIRSTNLFKMCTLSLFAFSPIEETFCSSDTLDMHYKEKRETFICVANDPSLSFPFSPSKTLTDSLVFPACFLLVIPLSLRDFGFFTLWLNSSIIR